MKKILLIAPLPQNEFSHQKLPPLGLASLAAVLIKSSHQVKIFDMEVEPKDLFEEIRSFCPDVIGIQIMTHYRFFVSELARKIKKLFPLVRIVIGGPHSTLAGEEYLEKNPWIDFAIKGEGECSFTALVNQANLRNIPGLVYRNGGEILENSIDKFIDLDKIPPLPYHLLSLNKYKYELNGMKCMSIFTSRGCPNRCIFCAANAIWPYTRFRSPSKVIAEIKTLKKLGYEALIIEDDTFGLNKKFTIEIAERIKALKMPFRIRTRAEVLDGRFLEILKNCGCESINFGVESGDENILRIIKKNINLSQVKQVVSWCAKFKISADANFMLGNLGETVESASRTLKFANYLAGKGVRINWSYGVFIFPGTRLERMARKKNLLPQNFSWEEKYFCSRNKLLGASPHLPILETPQFRIENILKFKKKWYKPIERIKRTLRSKISSFVLSIR